MRGKLIQLEITRVKGRWFVDGKKYEDLNQDERDFLNDFFVDYKEKKELYDGTL